MLFRARQAFVITLARLQAEAGVSFSIGFLPTKIKQK